MRQCGEVPLFEVSAACYDMFIEEWGRALVTRSTMYPHYLLISEVHVRGLTRDSREEFKRELSWLTFSSGGLVLLEKMNEV